ncbi:hypothetical protein ABT173_10640 [Streptomyces sp. NPDC001795]
MSDKHHPLTRRQRLQLIRAAVTGIAQGATRALLDLLLTHAFPAK